MEHMRAICKDIGPRPSTSEQERRAADYVEDRLRKSGITDIQRQTFKSQNSAGWIMLISFALGLLATLLASTTAWWATATSFVLFTGSACLFRQLILVRPTLLQKAISRWTSQNVIATIPAKSKARQTIYLIGHLDSQKQRFQFPPSFSRIMKAQTSLPIVVGALGAISVLAKALSGYEGNPWWLWPIGAAYLWGLVSVLYDETQPHVEGANDNATAVSLLLGIARAAKEQPLQRTDIVLLFTGCEEVGCTGMENYLQQFAPPGDSTFWIDIEMVGTGNLCYVTKHGISYLTPYAPDGEMVQLASRVAQALPDLGVKGKDMVILEEVATLRNKGYRAICIAGYNEKGVLPNWHRVSDTLENIEPETLSKAARYTWELMQEIDAEGRYMVDSPPASRYDENASGRSGDRGLVSGRG